MSHGGAKSGLGVRMPVGTRAAWPPVAGSSPHEQFFSVAKKVMHPSSASTRGDVRPGSSLLVRNQTQSEVRPNRPAFIDPGYSKPPKQQSSPSIRSPGSGENVHRSRLSQSADHPKAALPLPRSRPPLPAAKPACAVSQPRVSWNLDLLMDGADTNSSMDYGSASDLEDDSSIATDKYRESFRQSAGFQPLPELPEGRRLFGSGNPMVVRKSPFNGIKHLQKPYERDELRVKRSYMKRKQMLPQTDSRSNVSAVKAAGMRNRKGELNSLHDKAKWGGNVNQSKNDLSKKIKKRKVKSVVYGVAKERANALTPVQKKTDGHGKKLPFQKQAGQRSNHVSVSAGDNRAMKTGGKIAQKDRIASSSSNPVISARGKNPSSNDIEEDLAISKQSVQERQKKSLSPLKDSNMRYSFPANSQRKASLQELRRSVEDECQDLHVDTSSDDDMARNLTAPMYSMGAPLKQVVQRSPGSGAMSTVKRKNVLQRNTIFVKKNKKMSEYWRNKLASMSLERSKRAVQPQARLKRKYTARPVTSENTRHIEEAIDRVLAQANVTDDSDGTDTHVTGDSDETDDCDEVTIMEKIQKVTPKLNVRGKPTQVMPETRKLASTPPVSLKSGSSPKLKNAASSADSSQHSSIKHTASGVIKPDERTSESISSKSNGNDTSRQNVSSSLSNKKTKTDLKQCSNSHTKKLTIPSAEKVIETRGNVDAAGAGSSPPDKPTPVQNASAYTPDPRAKQLKQDLAARVVADLQLRQQQIMDDNSRPVTTAATMPIPPPVKTVNLSSEQQVTRPVIRLRHRHSSGNVPPRVVRMSEQAYLAGATISEGAISLSGEPTGEAPLPSQEIDLPETISTSRLKTFLDSGSVNQYRSTCALSHFVSVNIDNDGPRERLVFISRAEATSKSESCNTASGMGISSAAQNPEMSLKSQSSHQLGAACATNSLSSQVNVSSSTSVLSLLQTGVNTTDYSVQPLPTSSHSRGGLGSVADPTPFSPVAFSHGPPSGNTSPRTVSSKDEASSLPGSVTSSAPVSPRLSSCVLNTGSVDACTGNIHSLQRAVSGSFSCNRCSKRFASLSAQIYHELQTHMIRGQSFKCIGCAMVVTLSVDPTEEVKALLEHYVKHVDEEGHLSNTDPDATSWNCVQCKREFFDPAVYGQHEMVCASLNYSCTFCGAKYETVDQVRWHEVNHLQGMDGKYTCDLCPNTYLNRMQILGHRRFHFKEKNIECPKCGKKFMTTGMLTMHNKWKHSQGPCRFCGRPFTSATARQCHEEHTHLKHMMHMCNVCQFRVMSASQLRVHKRSHSAETPHVCAECSEGFFSRNLLRKHMAKCHETGTTQTTEKSSSPLNKADVRVPSMIREGGTRKSGGGGGEPPTPAELRTLFEQYKATWTGPSDSMTFSDLETSSDEDEKRGEENIQAMKELFRSKDSFSVWSCPVCHEYFTKLWGVRAHIMLKHPGSSVIPNLHENTDSSVVSKREFLQKVKRNAKLARRKLKLQAKAQSGAGTDGSGSLQRGRPRKLLQVDNSDLSGPRKRGRPRKFDNDLGLSNPVTSAGVPSSTVDLASSPALVEEMKTADISPTNQPGRVIRMAVPLAPKPPCVSLEPTEPKASAEPAPPPNCVEKRRWKCTCGEVTDDYDDLVTHTYIAHPDADLPQFKVVIEYVPKSNPSVKVCSDDMGSTVDTSQDNEIAQEAHDQALLASARVVGAEKRRAPSTTKVAEGVDAAKRRKIIQAARTDTVETVAYRGPVGRVGRFIMVKAPSSKPPNAVCKSKVQSLSAKKGSASADSFVFAKPIPDRVKHAKSPRVDSGDDSYKKTYTNSSRRYRGEGTSVTAAPTEAAATPPAATEQADNEPLYCFCQSPYDEVSEMIGCDSDSCKYEWFHFECVGIVVPPKGEWFCPDCAGDSKKSK